MRRNRPIALLFPAKRKKPAEAVSGFLWAGWGGIRRPHDDGEQGPFIKGSIRTVEFKLPSNPCGKALAKVLETAHDRWMTRRLLDDKLDCKACGTIQMDIPANADENTPIHCSNCGALLGNWGDLQDDLFKQIRDAEVLELDRGKISKIS